MLRIFLLIFLFISHGVQASPWNDADCGKTNANEGKIFELNITMSFHGASTFKFCKKPERHFLVLKSSLKTTGQEFEKKVINLSNKEIEIITNKYIRALKYNTLDDTSGLDGSTWCIESQRGFTTYTKACFWSPGSNTEKRGLAGLYELGVYLWEISELKEQGIRLY